MYTDIYHVLVGVLLGISFMVTFAGLNRKDYTVFWLGIIGFLIGSFLFLTI